MTSRKLITFLLASIVILRPFLLKVLHICFLIWSIRRVDSRKIPRPSSLYKPTLVLMVSGSWHSRYDPTSSQVSAPSNEPIVTSNESWEFFFDQGVPLLKRSDFFFSWKMISLSASVISV